MAIEAAFMVPHPPMIIPEVGGGRERDIQTTIDSYLRIAKEIGEIKPDTIIISSPHTVLYSDYFHISSKEIITGDLSIFGAKNISFNEKVDMKFVRKIEEFAKNENLPIGMLDDDNELDHGSMIPLYFIRKYLKDYQIVILGLSALPFSKHYEIGKLIQRVSEDLNRRVVYVASGDLSHKLQEYGPYGFVKEGPIYDDKIMSIMRDAKFLELLEFDNHIRERASECGHRSFIMMAGALDGIEVKSLEYSHEDITGVGYGICSYYPLGKDPSRKFLNQYLENVKTKIKAHPKDDYIDLARKSITSYIERNEIIPVPSELPNEMTLEKAGVFVSLHEEGSLRGCIGTISPVTNCIAEEIIRNAIESATNDPRFSSVTKEEIPYLEISVDVLKAPENISSINELDTSRYGVIVTSGYKRGLLLPNIDGVDTVEEQVKIAKSKGNITDYEEIKLQRFEVIRHK